MTIDTTAMGTYYANLLPIQYISKPKAYADIYAEAKGLWLDDVFSQIRNGFNKDTAVGVQLDIVAKYVGATRTIPGQVGGASILSDDDLRTFINFKIIQNNSNHSNYSIDYLLYSFFGTNIVMTDNFDMTITYTCSTANQALLNRLLAENALPKPAGVGIIVVSMPNQVFGFNDYVLASPAFIYGFDDYNLAPSGAVMLQY